jgi:ubiquinone/menaquinone biosynthesis C-methylase UbiE
MQDINLEKEFFDQAAEDSAWITFDERGHKKILDLFNKFVKPRKDEKMVDLGCGTGEITYAIKKKFRLDITGVDISEKSINSAKGKYDGISFEIGDIKKTRFEDNQFDIVVFAAALHHFQKRDLILKEAYRILRPGGRLFAFDPNAGSPLLFLFRNDKSPFKSDKMKTKNEVLLDRKKISDELHKNGFVNITTVATGGMSFTKEYFKRLFPKPFYNVVYAYNLYQMIFDKSYIDNYLGEFLITFAEK